MSIKPPDPFFEALHMGPREQERLKRLNDERTRQKVEAAKKQERAEIELKARTEQRRDLNEYYSQSINEFTDGQVKQNPDAANGSTAASRPLFAPFASAMSNGRVINNPLADRQNEAPAAPQRDSVTYTKYADTMFGTRLRLK
ncbi:MAG: hypothetical protein IT290_07150 [Deltaproteobacteria bacterium]|nr:hypothetical protein [Deltaproteobacteria bacterium]